TIIMASVRRSRRSCRNSFTIIAHIRAPRAYRFQRVLNSTGVEFSPSTRSQAVPAPLRGWLDVAVGGRPAANREGRLAADGAADGQRRADGAGGRDSARRTAQGTVSARRR